MASTVVTAGLGYVFWAVAAHAFSSQQVGIGSAAISLCSATALFTYLGSSAMLIERLPGNEWSSSWISILLRVCSATALVTAVATAIAVPVLRTSPDYRSFFSSVPPILVAVVGAAAWTLVNLLGAAFIAARRSGRYLFIQTLVSTTKVLIVIPLAAVGAGAGRSGRSMDGECRARCRRRSRMARTSDGTRPPTWLSAAPACGRSQ